MRIPFLSSLRTRHLCVKFLRSDLTQRCGNRRRDRGSRTLLFACLTLIAIQYASADDLLTEARFDLAITQPISATVPRTELRDFLRRISEQRNVAIVLDCRVDPQQMRDISWVELPLAGAIDWLADEVESSSSIVGDTIIVGPPDSLRNLRTIIAIRLDELNELVGLDSPRQSRLRRRDALHWNDLDQPRDLAQSIADACGLRIENPEIIPHDLWAGAGIANANAVECLSILLMQVDLSFEWNANATAIRLVPYPADVAVERVHQPRGMTIEVAESDVRAEFPELSIEVRGQRLAAVARVEEHERIEEIVGIRLPRELSPTPMVPLARRTFTLTVVNQSVGGVIQALVNQGVPIDFDADQLTTDGADLSLKISLQLREASIEDLMEELCEPAGLVFEIDEEQVLLRARNE